MSRPRTPPALSRASPAGTGAPARIRRHALAWLLLAISAQGAAGGLTIIDELFVGIWSPFGSRWEASSSVCISGDGPFRVIATSAEREERFALDNGAGDEVPYQTFWRHRDRPGRGQALQPGIPSRKASSGHPAADCGGGANARVTVRVDRRAIDNAPPGVYDDTLLLTLSPL